MKKNLIRSNIARLVNVIIVFYLLAVLLQMYITHIFRKYHLGIKSKKITKPFISIIILLNISIQHTMINFEWVANEIQLIYVHNFAYFLIFSLYENP